mmetsp:Transcript_5841/g.12305  ORF Transcript_5841/g.12305 Transcript_5841/m.12305 type:complete len:89 (-) Transcript_5841:30-296(-)
MVTPASVPPANNKQQQREESVDADCSSSESNHPRSVLIDVKETIKTSNSKQQQRSIANTTKLFFLLELIDGEVCTAWLVLSFCKKLVA